MNAPPTHGKSESLTAHSVARAQPFGRDNVDQTYTTERVFPHTLLLLLKSTYLAPPDQAILFVAYPPARRLSTELIRVTQLDFRPLRAPFHAWNTQAVIDNTRVDLRLACLFHFNGDLATVHRYLGGNHVAAHRNPDVILPRVQPLLPHKLAVDLERIFRHGCPAKLNAEGTNKEFATALKYGNHQSVSRRVDVALEAMNKEDRKDHVLTFPSWIAPFLPDLMLTPNGLLSKPGKKDRLLFDASFMHDMTSRPYNHLVSLADEPDIVFGNSRRLYYQSIYNLRITYPTHEIYLFDDDVPAAFRNIKYHPNVISAKGFIIPPYLFIPTGLTFGDSTSPASFEAPARARTAMSANISQGTDTSVLTFPEFITQLQFTPPPTAVDTSQFATARRDKYNPGAPAMHMPGRHAVQYNMHVDDNLYAAAGHEGITWAIRCSIQGLLTIMGPNDPTLRTPQPDMDKFTREPVGYTREQLGNITDSRTMIVTITAAKRQATIDSLNHWLSKRSFSLHEAAKLLGTLVSLASVNPWGIFLVLNLYHAMSQSLSANAARLWHTPEFQVLIRERASAANHPTDSAKFRWFSKKVARAIYDCKSLTYLSKPILHELTFLHTILANPDKYAWSSPIAHLIDLEADYATLQDSSLSAAGGFSRHLQFWWSLTWPTYLHIRTLKYLPRGDKHLISINMLEYAALIVGFAATIVAWESLPTTTRPPTPLVTLYTDNASARAWTTKIAGLKSPQGRALARLFAHLLMFSAVGIESRHIAGTDNDIADYLSRHFQNLPDTPHLSFQPLQKKYPWLKNCHRFQPSRELLLLLYSALQNGLVTLPETRVKLGQIQVAPHTSNTLQPR